MNRITTPFVVAAAALASLTLSAEDFRPLMQVTHSTWPEKQHIGVVCDYRASKDQVQALAMAAGEGFKITVADARQTDHASLAATILANRNRLCGAAPQGPPVP